MFRFVMGVALILAMSATIHRRPSESSWTTYQNSPTHNAVFDAQGLKLSWFSTLGDRVNGGLALVDGTLYVDSFDRQLYALDERTGRPRWIAQADNVLMSTPVVRDGIVFVGSGTDGFLRPNDANSQIWGRPGGDYVYAFSAVDGHLIWKVHTVGEDMPSPAITGNRLIFANGDGHVYAIDIHTGRKFWIVPIPGIVNMASMTIASGMAFVSMCHNAPHVCETRAIAVTDGHTIWRNPIGGSDCTPTVDNGLVFVNAAQENDKRFHTGGTVTVAAINEHSGRTAWTYRTHSAPFTYIASSERHIAGTAHRGVLYQPIVNTQSVVAFDEATGVVKWAVHTSANVKMSPVIKGQRVYFGDTGGILYSIDRRSGAIVSTTSFRQPFSTSPPIIAGDTIFIANATNVVAMPLERI